MTLKTRLWQDQGYYRQAYVFHRPHPVFAPWIAYFWESRFELLAPTQFKELTEVSQATLSASIVLNLGEPFQLQPKGEAAVVLPEAVFIGHHTQPLTFVHHPGNRLIGVKLKEAGIFALLGLPARDFLNKWTPLREIMSLQNWQKNPRLFLESQLYQEPQKDKDWFQFTLVSTAMQQYKDLGFQPDLESLAREQNLSVKSLYRYFWNVLGMSPRKALSILRLNEALRNYQADPEGFSVYDFGYYDRSHFLKDLKLYRG